MAASVLRFSVSLVVCDFRKSRVIEIGDILKWRLFRFCELRFEGGKTGCLYARLAGIVDHGDRSVVVLVVLVVLVVPVVLVVLVVPVVPVVLVVPVVPVVLVVLVVLNRW